MRFFTPVECAGWCDRLKLVLDDCRKPIGQFTHPHRLRCTFPPSFSQLLWFSRIIESAIRPRKTCLLWVTGWSIFDFRLLQEAPGHLCLDYERPEVVTLTYLSILFGRDVHLIPTVDYARAFVCHDEWVQFGFDQPSEFEETRKALEAAKLEVSVI